MKTVKDYARERSVTHQAVYQMIKTHQEELDGLIVKQGRIRFLTEEAEAILDKYRNQSQIVLEKADQTEYIKQLEEEVKKLLIKTAVQADKIAELSAWKADQAVAIAEINSNRLLIESLQTDKTKLEEEINSFEKTFFGLYRKR